MTNRTLSETRGRKPETGQRRHRSVHPQRTTLPTPRPMEQPSTILGKTAIQKMAVQRRIHVIVEMHRRRQQLARQEVYLYGMWTQQQDVGSYHATMPRADKTGIQTHDSRSQSTHVGEETMQSPSQEVPPTHRTLQTSNQGRIL